MNMALLAMHLGAMAIVLAIIGADAVRSGARVESVLAACGIVLAVQLFAGVLALLLVREPSVEASAPEEFSCLPSAA